MDNLHFERYEFKYFVRAEIIDAIRSFVRPYVAPDHHAAKNSDGRYSIYNIYLDSPNLELFHAGDDGENDRFKLRIRWYDHAARGPFFFEVKRKVGRVIVKDRVPICLKDFRAIVKDGPLGITSGDTRDRLLRFTDNATMTGATPVILCRYTREPFESIFGEYARITFDRSMCYQAAHDFEVPGNSRRWGYIDSLTTTRGIPRAAIMELKFTNEFPRWMSDLISEFGLERMGFSKYGSSVSQWTSDERGMGSFERTTCHGA